MPFCRFVFLSAVDLSVGLSSGRQSVVVPWFCWSVGLLSIVGLSIGQKGWSDFGWLLSAGCSVCQMDVFGSTHPCRHSFGLIPDNQRCSTNPHALMHRVRNDFLLIRCWVVHQAGYAMIALSPLWWTSTHDERKWLHLRNNSWLFRETWSSDGTELNVCCPCIAFHRSIMNVHVTRGMLIYFFNRRYTHDVVVCIVGKLILEKMHVSMSCMLL